MNKLKSQNWIRFLHISFDLYMKCLFFPRDVYMDLFGFSLPRKLFFKAKIKDVILLEDKITWYRVIVFKGKCFYTIVNARHLNVLKEQRKLELTDILIRRSGFGFGLNLVRFFGFLSLNTGLWLKIPKNSKSKPNFFSSNFWCWYSFFVFCMVNLSVLSEATTIQKSF